MVYFSIFLKMASYKNIIQDLENLFKSVFIVGTYYIVYYCCSWPHNWKLWPVNNFQMSVMEYNIIFMSY